MFYKYFDHSKTREGEVIFECEAESISAADEKLKEATNYVAAKCSFIGCQVSKDAFENVKMMDLLERAHPSVA